MRISPLVSTKVKDRKATVLLDDEKTAFYKNVKLSNGKIRPASGLKKVMSLSFIGNEYKIYSILNKLYVYSDSVLNQIVNGEQIEVFNSEEKSALTLLPVTYQGEKGIFISEKGGRKVVKTDSALTVIGVPEKEFYYVLGNLFFAGQENHVLIGDSYSISNFNDDIIFPDEAGEITGFSSQNKKLLIFCQNAIYELSPFGEKYQFTLQKLNFDNLSIKKGSVKRIGDKTLFISGDKLCYLKDDKITDLSEVAINFEFGGEAFAFENSYLLPIKKDNEEMGFIFRYDINDHSKTVYPNAYNCADDGYIVLNDGVYQIDDKIVISDKGEWESKPLTLESLGKKTLVSLMAKSSNQVTVILESDFGKKTFSLDDKCNKVKPNLTFNHLKVKFIGENLEIDNIELTYRLKEES